ncbi:hypothetical protein NMY22_g13506 [Coprinellus aureogranulatus]|nr:hypothetical protein NMY22_g13506 [Coprinellus aureogranulatus]
MVTRRWSFDQRKTVSPPLLGALGYTACDVSFKLSNNRTRSRRFRPTTPSEYPYPRKRIDNVHPIPPQTLSNALSL